MVLSVRPSEIRFWIPPDGKNGCLESMKKATRWWVAGNGKWTATVLRV